jgi:hypothetical protein
MINPGLINLVNTLAIGIGVLLLQRPLGWRIALGIGLIAWALLPIPSKLK